MRDLREGSAVADDFTLIFMNQSIEALEVHNQFSFH